MSKKKKKTQHKKKNSGKKKKTREILYKNLDWAGEISAYFGFSPFHFPEVIKEDREKAAAIEKEEKETTNGLLPFINLPERISVLRDYQRLGKDKEPQPVLMSHSSNKPEQKNFRFGLEIIGSAKSIADATVIKTTFEILRERGFGPLNVSINSMGDRESFNRFIKEFNSYCRKNLENINPACRQEFKTNPLSILSCGHEKCGKIFETAPKSMNSLSEPCRAHFKEVLEHIEMLNIPYKIDDSLIADKTFGCQTIFKITEEKDEKRPLATGARYNILARKIGFKKEIPAIGAKIELHNIENKITTSKKVEKPLVCFVQIGFEAKLKSLQVIEMLREAKIPIYQSLSRDKLSSQLQIAENLKIPYVLILGQKEAVENSIIVRYMATRSQETIPIGELPKYLEKLLRHNYKT